MVNKILTIGAMIFISLFMIGIIEATEYTSNAHGEDMSTLEDNSNVIHGIKGTLKVTGIYNVIIEKSASTGATGCTLAWENRTVIKNSTFVGNNCSIYFGSALPVGGYLFTVWKGASYELYRTGGSTLPLSKTTFYYNSSCNAGCGTFVTNQIRGIANVWTSGENGTALPIINISTTLPINGTSTTSQLVNFTTNLSITITNFSYQWINATTVLWYPNGTRYQQNYSTTSGNNTIINRTMTILNSSMYWWNTYACYGNTTYSNCTWSTNNNSLSIDYIPPVITITERDFTYQQMLTDNQVINYTITESNLDTCYYNYNGTNISLNTSLTGFEINLSVTDTNITIYCNDTLGLTGEDYYNWNITSTAILIRILNYLGGVISSATFDGDIIYTGNPYYGLMNSYLNDTTKEINLTIEAEDRTYYNRNENFTLNLNYTETSYNLTLQPNQLVLEFYNGTSPNNTKFEIYDGNRLFANNSGSMAIVQQDLSEGNVYVRFNEDEYGINWTQFYEYENDYETHISENLTLLNNPDWVIYFNVRSKDNRVIENAVLRAEYSLASEGVWANKSLIGQRLTQMDGSTFFWFDSSSYVTVTVTAEGYDAREIILTVGDEDATSKTTSYSINLDESSSGVSNNIWVYYPIKINNRTKNIPGIIMAKSVDQVKINTNYRIALGLGDRELTNIGRGRYNSTLIAGQDFATTGTDNIIVYIYVDGINIKNWTITDEVPTRIFDFDNIDSKTTIVAGSIALVFIAGAIGMLFQSATAGFTVFMFGSIMMSLIAIQFLYLSIISLLYFVFKLIAKVISE